MISKTETIPTTRLLSKVTFMRSLRTQLTNT